MNHVYVNEDKKGQVGVSRNVSSVYYKDASSSNSFQDNVHLRLIPLAGCCSSAASQLLTNRWAAAMKCHDDPSIDSSERPVIYSGSGASAWGQFRLPHQMDFLAQLRRAMHNANASNASVNSEA